MPDFDKTDKIIPISWLESILENDDVFQKFVTNFSNPKEGFNDITLEDYLKALNEYMNFTMTMENDLPKKYFEKMNYINAYYRTNEAYYDYDKYLDRTERLIPISLLQEILTNEETLEKFLNFEENKEYFPNQSLHGYIHALIDFVDYYRKNNMPIPVNMGRNLDKIKSTYIFELEHKETLEGFFEEKKVDPELEMTVLKRVNPKADPFTLARGIYIELCKVTSYDINYAARGKDDKIAEEIYNKEAEEVTLENNKLVCKSFSEIYATLLNKVGIKAITAGDYHRFTLFLCNGIVVKADATQTGSNFKEQFSLPDIIRVKLGLPTSGFIANNHEFDISYAATKADLQNSKYNANNIQAIEDRYRKIKKLEIKDKKDFGEMIDFLNQVETDKLEGLEYTEYLKLLVHSGLDKEVLKNIWYSTCYQKQDDEYHAVFVIDGAKYSGDQDSYYVFDQASGLSRFTAEELNGKVKSEEFIATNQTFRRNLEVRELGVTK